MKKIAIMIGLIITLTACGAITEKEPKIDIPDNLEPHEKIESFMEIKLEEQYGENFYVISKSIYEQDKELGILDENAPMREGMDKIIFFEANVWDEHTWMIAKEAFEKGGDNQKRWDKERKKIFSLCQSFQEYSDSLDDETRFISVTFYSKEFDGELVYGFNSATKTEGNENDYYSEEYSWMHD